MLEFETRDGKGLQFDSIAAARDWVQGELTAFNWMNGNCRDVRITALQERHQRIYQLRDALMGLAGQDEVIEKTRLAEQELERVYGKERDTPRSDTAQGRYLQALAAHSPYVANATAALLLGDVRPGEHNERSVFQAAIAASVAFDYSVLGLEADLARIRSDGETGLENARTLVRKLNDSVGDFASHADGTIYEWKSRLEKLEEQSATKLDEIIETSRADYAKARSYFENELSLKAPVFYWRNVAENARKWSRVWGLVFAGELLILGAALGSSVSAIRNFLVGSERESAAIIITVAVSTLVFWALRMSARIFLSNYHRATDAAERETMVATFLALQREKLIGAEQLALVLAPLFRPGSTGLVKDDAAPEFSAAALLTKERRG